MNYFYDLPNELQRKIHFVCLNGELHEHFLKRASFMLYCNKMHLDVCVILISDLCLEDDMQIDPNLLMERLLREWNSESDETRDDWKLVGEYAVKFLTVTMGQRIA